MRSHRKAAAAKAAGKFKDEIVPVSTKVKDPKTGVETPVVISEDDGVRGAAGEGGGRKEGVLKSAKSALPYL